MERRSLTNLESDTKITALTQRKLLSGWHVIDPRPNFHPDQYCRPQTFLLQPCGMVPDSKYTNGYMEETDALEPRFHHFIS